MPPFHLAFPVTDLAQTRDFYEGVLGCAVGRHAPRWIDFNFFGHQISAHLSETADPGPCNEVDGQQVPVRHFGAVLPWVEWEALAERLRGAGVSFLIEPATRFEGQTGEQGTFFIRDPSGNALEFKTFRDPAQLFAHDS